MPGDCHCCATGCGKPVRQKKLWQWFFRITDYAEDLLVHCDELPGWPDKVLTMQKNWIGKSQGAEIRFPIEGSEEVITVFTTRHDTVFGATFMCLAPEHPLVAKLTSPDKKAEVEAYIKQTFQDHGYLLDPHTATCFKAHVSCRDKPLPDIVYSTAEWTKFSPTIAQALTGEKDSHDIDALKSIAATANTTIPPMIEALFERPVAHDTVIDKQDIEREVLAFI